MSDDIIEIIRARHLRDDRWRNLPSMICPQAHDDRALLLAEVERLRAALKPFAVEAEAYDPPEGDDAAPAWASRFTCGNLRDARKALGVKS